jgi:hypothetical protein
MQIADHLRATRELLYGLLAARGRDAMLARRLGLAESAARSLCWVRQLPAARGGRGYTLGFDDACSGAALPMHLRSAIDGTPLPVRAVRGLRHAVAHARWVRASNDSHTFLTGTLGAVLRPDGQPERRFAVTAGHVFGAAASVSSGDRVRFDFANEAAPPIIGRLLDWQPNFARLPLECSFDAGLAEVGPDDLRALVAQPGDWPTGTSSAFVGDRLRLRTRGRVIAGGNVAFLGASLCLNGDTSRSYLLRDALVWRTDSPSEGGDSGAPVWNDSDELVALHAGGQLDGDPLSAIAVPIARVLRWAGSDIVRRGELVQTAAPVRPAPTPAPADRDAGDTLARTMHGEARGEGEPGLAAVAHVVLNRVAARSWWGRDVVSVCRKPFQFSCWNDDDPNRDLLLRLTATSPGFALAQDTAARVLAADAEGSRAAHDPTAGATHYYAWRVMAPPRWALGRTPCARIGGHVFFKGVG